MSRDAGVASYWKRCVQWPKGLGLAAPVEDGRSARQELARILRLMRRKAGTVLPIERELLESAMTLQGRGVNEFHGFLIAHEIRERKDAKDLIAYGNLYRILERMEKYGWLVSNWEDPDVAAEERRPRRRLYRLTASGVTALQRQPHPIPRARSQQRLAEQ